MNQMTQDVITVKQLKVSTIIGVAAWERKVKQTITVDLEVPCQADQVATHDLIQETINYAELAQETIHFIEQIQCQLIETLAEKTAQHLLAQFALPWVRLTINKPGAIREAAGVSITIKRSRSDDH